MHFIDLVDKLKAQHHLFIPPLVWEPTSIASAIFLAQILRLCGKEASVLIHPHLRDRFADAFDIEVAIFPQNDQLVLARRPEWVWLWGLSRGREHLPSLSDFLIGCDAIQVLDWTSDGNKKLGDYFHKTHLLGGLNELSWNLARELAEDRQGEWSKNYLNMALMHFLNLYPFITRDAPTIHLLGRLATSQGKARMELGEAREELKGPWKITRWQGLSDEALNSVQDTVLDLYMESPEEHQVLIFENDQQCGHIAVVSPKSEYEFYIRQVCKTTLTQQVDGRFNLGLLEKVIDLLPQNGLPKGTSLKLQSWPKPLYHGENIGMICTDEEWASEKERKLATDDDDEEDEEEDKEEVSDYLTWDSGQLLQRILTLEQEREQQRKEEAEKAYTYVVDDHQDEMAQEEEVEAEAGEHAEQGQEQSEVSPEATPEIEEVVEEAPSIHPEIEKVVDQLEAHMQPDEDSSAAVEPEPQRSEQIPVESTPVDTQAEIPVIEDDMLGDELPHPDESADAPGAFADFMHDSESPQDAELTAKFFNDDLDDVDLDVMRNRDHEPRDHHELKDDAIFTPDAMGETDAMAVDQEPEMQDPAFGVEDSGEEGAVEFDYSDRPDVPSGSRRPVAGSSQNQNPAEAVGSTSPVLSGTQHTDQVPSPSLRTSQGDAKTPDAVVEKDPISPNETNDESVQKDAPVVPQTEQKEKPSVHDSDTTGVNWWLIGVIATALGMCLYLIFGGSSN